MTEPASKKQSKDELELAALMERLEPLGAVDPYVKCVLYGPFGVGKSTLAATAGERILWVDGGENGWVSLKNHPELYKKVVQRVQVTNRNILMVLGRALVAGTFPLDVDTVILDTATDMVQAEVRAVTQANVKKGDKGRIDTDPYKPERPDYLIANNRMREAFSLFRDAPINVIWVCQEKSYTDANTGISVIRPEAPDAIGQFFGQMAHLQARLTAKGTGEEDKRERTLQVHPTGIIDAKTRIGGLPTLIKNPNLSEIFSKWGN